jgi:RecA/RadA recombinase
MAKKEDNKKKKFEFSKIGNIMNNIAKSVPIIIDDKIKEKKFISTGVYLLDAAISSRLLGGGVQSNRITVFAGESGTGKSFLAYSVAKHAQKDGYGIIYIDTEYSVDLDELYKYGLDISPDKFILVRSNKVEDINVTLTQLLDTLKEQKLAGVDIQPTMIVLDSIGQMASNKEKADLLKGDIKQDMTKAKAIGSLFRSINTDLGFLDIPMIVCNHTYLTQDLFPQEVLKGGRSLVYSASVIGMMSKSKLKTGEEDDMDLGQSGITVLFKTAKNRLAKPKKIRFDISFKHGMNQYSGLDAFCRPEFFDRVGIAKGKMEVDKSTGEIKFIPGGNRWYVRHLDKYVTTKMLFKPEVFTIDVLKALEPIVNDYFRYKSIDEIEEVEKQFNSIVESDEGDYDEFVDNYDAEDLFE